MSQIISDLKKNLLYYVQDLKGVRLNIKDDDGRHYSLHDFVAKAQQQLLKDQNKYQDAPPPEGVVSALLGLRLMPENGLEYGHAHLHTFLNGFNLGRMFERLRINKALKLSIEEFTLTAAEMDDVMQKYKEQGTKGMDEDILTADDDDEDEVV